MVSERNVATRIGGPTTMLGLIGNTPLVELHKMSPKAGVRIFLKLEGQNPTGSLKDRIAKYMIEKAEADGNLKPGVVILEPSSGNTGISLAFVARLNGHKVTVVMPDNVSPERTQLLQAYGADIVYSDGRLGTNGSIALAQKLAAENPRFFMLYQYGNDANPRAHYETTGVEILRDLPDVDVFVAGLGTGGTLMGVGRRLKERNPATRIVAVAPEPDDAIAGLRVLEEGFIPPILDMKLLDARMMVRSVDAFRTTKRLLHEEGIFTGVSAGSVAYCCIKLAERMERGNVVGLLADGGWKYLSTGLWNREYEDMEGEIKGKLWW